MSNLLRDMIQKRKSGIFCGVPSYCTANAIVIEAILEQAKRFDDTILIEATANQVNQFGGYTGMKPADFRDFVYCIADKTGVSREKVILGGDHLGPLTWANEPEESAMEKAVTLVKLFVEAGYKKIHLDTSMKLADDPVEEMLSDEVIARRGARLYRACEETFLKMKEEHPEEERPVFIIGSEVPIPGGAQEEEDSVSVTKPAAVEKTINTYKEEFDRAGLKDAFDNIIGIVVQPGVEFGDDEVFRYDPSAANELCKKVAEYSGIVMEGHSTDYQSPQNLKNMVRDGIAILKVGPALTFGMRDGLFALTEMEKYLIPEEDRVNFMDVLENVMFEHPDKWKKYYHGTDKEVMIKRKFSFSDRCRYYMTDEKIVNAIDKLFDNFDGIDIPLGLLHQHMPLQYVKVRDGSLSKDARSLVKDSVIQIVETYNYATKYNYVIGEAYI